jgi:hypothetical protein
MNYEQSTKSIDHVVFFFCGVLADIEVPVYIQKDKYTEAFALKADNKVHHGQKNREGENWFVIFYDTSRRPFQVRFVQLFLFTKRVLW